MKHYVVMVAGGTGTRMRLATAKQFLNVEGLPLMWWTLRRFREALPEAEVTLVLHESLFEEFAVLEAKHGSAWRHPRRSRWGRTVPLRLGRPGHLARHRRGRHS